MTFDDSKPLNDQYDVSVDRDMEEYFSAPGNNDLLEAGRAVSSLDLMVPINGDGENCL